MKSVGIKKIEHIGKDDVYNLEVSKVNNFSVNEGIVVHNCCDAERYLVMGFWKYLKNMLPVSERKDVN